MNLVVRHVRKQVPPYELPGALRFNDALEQGEFLPFEPVTTTHDDIAFLQYTGGTTGVAKGAMLTHRNMVANVLQAGAWLGTEARLGEDTIITPLPLYHIFALTGNLLVFIRFGAHNVLIANPRDFAGVRQGAAFLALQLHQRREHAVQRAAEHAGIRRARLQSAAHHSRRRHGRAALGCRALAASHGQRADAGLGPDRDVAGSVHQPVRAHGIQRLDRPADPLDRNHDPQRRRP